MGHLILCMLKEKPKGVAPRARLAVCKVAWQEGPMTSDIVAGVEAAIDDGVDVKSWQNPLSASLFSAMEKGIVYMFGRKYRSENCYCGQWVSMGNNGCGRHH